MSYLEASTVVARVRIIPLGDDKKEAIVIPLEGLHPTRELALRRTFSLDYDHIYLMDRSEARDLADALTEAAK